MEEEKKIEEGNNSHFEHELDDIISRERKKTLEKKFGIKKEYIEMEDLENIVEKMNLTKSIGKDEVEKIFHSIDVNNSGKVKVSTFFDTIIYGQKEYLDIFKKINNQLTTKSEKIIIKLKNLKSRAAFANDKESLDDLDWYK